MSLLQHAVQAMGNEDTRLDPKTPLEMLQVLGEFVRICNRYTQAIEDAHYNELAAQYHFTQNGAL